MKLLLDQNLSHRLVSPLAVDFPGTTHVRSVGLATADDSAVWDFAKHGGFCIASKDSEFKHRAFLYGPPPKVIWLRVGNCSIDAVRSLIQASIQFIQDFDADPTAALLVLP